jgi:hypothetical protein
MLCKSAARDEGHQVVGGKMALCVLEGGMRYLESVVRPR